MTDSDKFDSKVPVQQETSQDKQQTKKALDTLCESNPRNAYMFKRYYYDGETFTQLAKDFNLTVARVEQIIKSVFKKLR